MFGLGGMEMVALLALGLLLFGKKLPDMARSLAKSIHAFKTTISGMDQEIEDSSYSRHSMPLPPERMPPPRFDGPASNPPAPSI